MGHILICEDNEAVASVARTILERAGHTVDLYSDGIEVLEYLNTGGSADLLVTDLILPSSMSGFGLIDRVLARRPKLPVLIMTGHLGGAPKPKSERLQNVVILQKPFRAKQLEATVRDLLANDTPQRKSSA